ncbi:MAG: LruC domain-containing protein [Bacteroides sp.]|nr:LruC domain-containing protein [Bacteroides sp.]
MNKLGFTNKHYAFAVLAFFLLCGCSHNKDFYQGSGEGETEKPSVDELFDFNTQQSCHVNIDYCLKDYVIIFEIYSEDPLVELDGNYVKKEIDPVYRASTDKNGKFMADITLPAYMEDEAWLYTDYLGVINCVKLNIIDHSLSFNQNDFMKEARGISPRATLPTGYTYPDEFKVLGNWIDKWGTPNYLLESQLPSADILYRVKKIYSSVDKEKIGKAHKELLEESVPVDIKIEKATKVYLTFINTTATIQNTVGYFTYKTGTTPDPDKIQKIISFPHTSPYYRNLNRVGALIGGDRIQLKYWDGEKFLDEFPAGISIGWFMIRMGYSNTTGNVTSKGKTIHDSTTSLNSDNMRHVVALHDNGEKLVSIGFEDQIEPYTDWNYADAVFSLEYDVDGAIGELPSLPSDSDKPGFEDNFVLSNGTIVFEDQWPDQGDYDMNDVAIYYEGKRYKNPISNGVTKCVDKFTVINNSNSADYQNGFGYQLSNLVGNNIKSVLIDGADKSSYLGENNLEPEQSHPTIILFDNAKNFIGKTITVTIEFNGEIAEGLLQAPYNPFIFIKNDRGRELHLATIPLTKANYKPTQKANMEYWGQDLDMTNEGDGIYYVAADLMPYALYVSGERFILPDERQNIADAYPKFTEWAKSQGEKK